MFFVVKDEGSTHAFEACIDRVEHFLVQFALARNPDLENLQISDWSIQGVYRSPPGGMSTSAHLFKKFLGFSDSVVDAAVIADTVEVSAAALLPAEVPSTSGTQGPGGQTGLAR
jgi:hypothetical protein